MKNPVKISKALGFMLRHKPEEFNVTMDEFGWVCCHAAASALNIDIAVLHHVVANQTKVRYEIDVGTNRIRALQGHSIPVKLDLDPIVLQEGQELVAYHGTNFASSIHIDTQGLKRQGRQYVHMSKDIETATAVGKRTCLLPLIYEINLTALIQSGEPVYESDNGIYLAVNVPPQFIKKVTS